MDAKSDRELLELAAKAAGYAVVPHMNAKSCSDLHFILARQNWNPIKDDGDALRLAVKLQLFDTSRVFDLRLEETRNNPKRSDEEILRRAIVRAAAEIGASL